MAAVNKNFPITVNGEPFLLLAGEVHNSNASSVEAMEPIWQKARELHLRMKHWRSGRYFTYNIFMIYTSRTAARIRRILLRIQ